MITHKKGARSISTDVIKMDHNGTTVDIQKVLQLDPGEVTAKEVWPPQATRLRIRAPWWDKTGVMRPVDGLIYEVSEFNIDDPAFAARQIELEVTVWPKSAGWKLVSTTGLDLGEHDGVTYYGDKDLTITLQPLATPGEEVHKIVARPHKGSAVEECVYTFIQKQISGELATPVLTWDFNGTTTDATGTYSFTNVFASQIEQVGEDPYRYTAGSKQYDKALEHYYSPNIANNGKYIVDLSDAISPTWFTDGFSISTVWYSGNATLLGFHEQAESNYAYSMDHAIFCSYGFKSITGVPDVNKDHPEQLEERIRRSWEHIALVVENLGDLTTNPNVSWGFRDPNETEGEYTHALLPVDIENWVPVGEDPATYNGPTTMLARWTSPWNKGYVKDVLSASEFFWKNEMGNPTDLSTAAGVVYHTYQNGVKVGEAAEIKSNHDWDAIFAGVPIPGNGTFEISMTNDTEDQNQLGYNQAISKISIYNGVLSEGQCAAETVEAGLTVGEAVSTVTIAKDPLNPRTRHKQGINDIDWSSLNLKTWMIDDQTVVLGVDPSVFYENQLKIEFPYDYVLDKNYHNGYDPEYNRQNIRKWSYVDIVDTYAGYLIDTLDEAETNVTVVNTSDQSARTWTKVGRTSDIISNYIYKDGWKNTDNTEVDEPYDRDYYANVYSTTAMGQFVYIKLDTPLAAGESIDISYRGNTVSIANTRDTVSHAIKVNQVGYPQYDIAKTAYVGRWLGMDANNSSWNARAYDPTTGKVNNWDLTFHIVDAADPTSTPVYTGTATVRQSTFQEDVKYRNGYNTNNGYVIQTGEKVWQLSFDDFNTVGEYQIYIPNIGYSWPFKIGDEATLKSFYTHMRGLWHHRSGDPHLTSDLTAWPMPDSTNESWEGQFPALHLGGPNESYGNGEFATSGGTPWYTVFGKHFGAMGASSTGARFRDVKGGYRDAADIDRRTWHERISRNLCELYLSDPTKFTDGQLNFYESGDGIPDIINAAEWGMEIWRKTQREDGAVSMWCETDHHEGYSSLRGDSKYYLAEPDCYTSLVFAQSAGLIARCYQTIDSAYARRKAAMWEDAAVRAFEFGHNPANVARSSYYYSNQTWYYKEDFYRNTESAHSHVYPASCTLFKLTGDPKYTEHFNSNGNWEKFRDSYINGGYRFGHNASSYETMFELQEYVPEQYEYIRRAAVFYADGWLDMIDGNNAYRQPHFSCPEGIDMKDDYLGVDKSISQGLSHRFSEFTQFSGGHLGGATLTIMNAHLVTGDQKYLDFLQRSSDFVNGATPTGVTETTGIGYVNPVWGLQGQAWDEYCPGHQVEPIPGISFYNHWNTDGALGAYTGVNVQAWIHNVSSYVHANYPGSYKNMIPGGYRDKYGVNMGSSKGAGSLGDVIKAILPKWRPNYSRIGAWYPIAGEYTVWETIYPKIIMTGYLLESNNTTSPDPTWLMTKETERENVEGWFTLP